MLIRSKINKVERYLRNRYRIQDNNGYLVFGNEIYIKRMFDLSGILHVKKVGDLNPNSKIFITAKLYEMLNKSSEEIEKIIKQKTEQYYINHRRKDRFD